MTRRNWPTSTSKRKKKRNVVRTQLVDALFLPKEITASTRIEAISEILYTSHIPNASNVICPETMTKYKKDRIFVTLCMSEKERNQSLRRNTTNNLPGYRHWSHGERCCHSQTEKKACVKKSCCYFTIPTSRLARFLCSSLKKAWRFFFTTSKHS